MRSWKARLNSIWKRKWFRALLILFVVLIMLFLLRIPILKEAGNFLISETKELQEAEILIVLSGGAYDRGLHAAELFEEGYAPRIVCPGGNTPPDFEALGMEMLESELTKHFMTDLGVPEEKILVIPEATSTMEESDVILEYMEGQNIESCIIVSSKFHTRRVRGVFEDKLRDAGISVQFSGAPSQTYEESAWWTNEYGLLTVNNEYVKLLYYWLKY